MCWRGPCDLTERLPDGPWGEVVLYPAVSKVTRMNSETCKKHSFLITSAPCLQSCDSMVSSPLALTVVRAVQFSPSQASDPSCSAPPSAAQFALPAPSAAPFAAQWSAAGRRVCSRTCRRAKRRFSSSRSHRRHLSTVRREVWRQSEPHACGSFATVGQAGQRRPPVSCPDVLRRRRGLKWLTCGDRSTADKMTQSNTAFRSSNSLSGQHRYSIWLLYLSQGNSMASL